jgi:Arc/MetJ family transcription regulator
MAREISKRDKTSLVIDREKVARAKKILGTTTIAETVDAALEDVINHDRRMQALERIRRDGGLGPSPRQVRKLRRPRVGPVPR